MAKTLTKDEDRADSLASTLDGPHRVDKGQGPNIQLCIFCPASLAHSHTCPPLGVRKEGRKYIHWTVTLKIAAMLPWWLFIHSFSISYLLLQVPPPD